MYGGVGAIVLSHGMEQMGQVRPDLILVVKGPGHCYLTSHTRFAVMQEFLG